MDKSIESQSATDKKAVATTSVGSDQPVRLDSRDLFQNSREVEIVHGNKIYRLRLTQQNKLILTA